jgi:ferric enterobactin receptor
MNTKTTSLSAILFWTIPIACFFSCQTVAAQEVDSLQVKGIVADTTTHQPVPATTIWLEDGFGKTTARLLADSTGEFHFRVKVGQPLVLHFSAVGYGSKTLHSADFLQAAFPRPSYDTFFLSPVGKTLQNVVVKGAKPLVKQEADRIVYDLQADPDSKTASVWEMMRKVPFLSVDGQDNILLKGSNSYRIFINGKPSGLLEQNPRNVLRSIPASTIISIEVITTPSAKYDAEGLAGIINIITTKKLSSGYSGNVNANVKFPANGPGAGGYFAFRQGRFAMSVTGGGSLNRTPETSSRRTRRTYDAANSLLDQQGTITSDNKTAYLGTDWSYELDSLQLISAQLNVSGNKGSNLFQQASSAYSNSAVQQSYLLTNDNQSSGTGMDAGINYQLNFRNNKNRLLTLSYRYASSQNEQSAGLDLSQQFNYPLPNYRQANTGRTDESTLQADYVQPLKNWVTEAGVKMIWRNNSSHYQYAAYDSLSGGFVPDATQTNRYVNRQQVGSVYNTWQTTVKSWNIKVGVRLEQTGMNTHFISTATDVRQHYLSIIPAAVIGKKMADNSNLSLSYSRRIQRPGIQFLNPFVDRSNPTFITTGNPDLKPAYTDVVQLSYLRSKKITFNLAIGCMLFRNLVSRFAVYDASTGITLTTFRNIGSPRIYKTNLYVSYPLTKKLTLRINSDVRYLDAELNTAKGRIENKMWSAYVNTAMGYQWGKGWRLNADLTVNSRNGTSVQSYTNGFALLNTSLQKEIKQKLTLSATLQNPFAKYRYSTETYFAPDFEQLTTNQLFYRSFGLSINYRFGKLKEGVKQSKRGIKNDDVD